MNGDRTKLPKPLCVWDDAQMATFISRYEAPTLLNDMAAQYSTSYSMMKIWVRALCEAGIMERRLRVVSKGRRTRLKTAQRKLVKVRPPAQADKTIKRARIEDKRLPDEMMHWSRSRVINFLQDYTGGADYKALARVYRTDAARVVEWVSHLRNHNIISGRMAKERAAVMEPDTGTPTGFGCVYALRLQEAKAALGGKLEVFGAPGMEIYKITGEQGTFTPAALLDYVAMGRRNLGVIKGGRA